MTRRTLQVLAAIVVGLVLLLLVVDRDLDISSPDRALLLPGFKEHANDASRITVARAGDTDGITARRDDGLWVVAERDGFPADVGALGQLISALAGAAIVEEKTSNPANYDRLGVDDPQSGGSGTLVSVAGPDFTHSVVLGNAAQGGSRYARVPDQATSYLVDRDPALPETPADWLRKVLLEIPASRVKRVSVAHADGETIVVEKADETQTDYDVVGIPEGRELRFPTAGNAMAGALDGLELVDVRRSVDAAPRTVTEFLTWDGLELTVFAVSEDDSTWLEISATADSEDVAVADEAGEINARLAGWQFAVADYKKNLLVRRWDDLLRDDEDE